MVVGVGPPRGFALLPGPRFMVCFIVAAIQGQAHALIEADAALSLLQVGSRWTRYGLVDELCEVARRGVADASAVTSASLQETPGNISCAAYRRLRNASHTTHIIGAYHKTGTVFAHKLIATLTGHRATENRFNIKDGSDNIFSSEPFSNFFGDPNIDIIKAVPLYQFVHLVRDPAALVMSAFRYHSKSDEPWLQVPMRDFLGPSEVKHGELLQGGSATRRNLKNVEDHVQFIKPELYRALNDAVVANNSYGAFLRNLSETDGLFIEAYRSLDTINLMGSNYARMQTDPNTLHVPLDSVRDNFDTTMRCVLSFLGITQPLELKRNGKSLKALDLKIHPELAEEHVTSSGIQTEEDGALLRFLSRIPHVEEVQKTLVTPAARSC